MLTKLGNQTHLVTAAIALCTVVTGKTFGGEYSSILKRIENTTPAARSASTGGTPVTRASLEQRVFDEPAAAPVQLPDCVHCKMESWRESGTLFRWSFSDETGGPDLNEPLVTDRPDFTEASTTVGRGVSQLEFGYTYVYDSEAGASTRTSSFGEPLLRHGILANWLEFRVALFPVQQRTNTAGRSQTTAGTEDVYLGFKIALTPQSGLLPEMAIIPQMTVPTGSNRFTNDEALPGANLIYAWKINEFLTTAGSTQANRSIDEATGRAYTEIAQSWTLGASLTDELSLYTEWFAFFPHSADTTQVEHYFNFGFTYFISNDIQWDIRFGRGLNRAADDYFVGSGLSIRFR